MKYQDFLEEMTECPFCKGHNNRLIEENETAYLTYALAPYHKHHLLVVPKRHVTTFLKLKDLEDSDISDLLDYGAHILEKLGYIDYSILVRNGKTVSIGKSVDHMHYHIIPNIHIGSMNHSGSERAILTKEEIDILMQEIRAIKDK